jgi:hypothetical protein
VRITGRDCPDRGTIGGSGANRDYRMSTYGKRIFESPDAGGHKQSFHEIFAMIRKNQVARIPANDIKTQRI